MRGLATYDDGHVLDLGTYTTIGFTEGTLTLTFDRETTHQGHISRLTLDSGAWHMEMPLDMTVDRPIAELHITATLAIPEEPA